MSYSNYNFGWVTKDARKFLSRGYLPKNQTLEERYKYISDKLDERSGIKGFSEKVYEYCSNGWVSFATPALINYGHGDNLPASCNYSSIEDSMDGIFSTLYETANLAKYGAGTAVNFSHIRPIGSNISTGGYSNGAVPWVKLYEEAINKVSQGCYDDKTEILTEFGWMYFEDLLVNRDIKVAQVLDDESVNFVKPLDYFKYKNEGNLLLFKDSKNVNLQVTKNHNMVYKNDGKIKVNGITKRIVKPKFYSKAADMCPLHRDVKYLHAGKLQGGIGMTALEKLRVAFQADGTFVKKSKQAIKFHLKKKRKIERLEGILSQLDYSYKKSYNVNSDTYSFYIKHNTEFSKNFNWVDLTNISQDWADSFLEEVSNWDGTKITEESFTYSSVQNCNVDVIQAVCSISGYKSKTNHISNRDGSRKDLFSITVSKGVYFGVEKIQKVEVPYEGFVYCVEVPSNRLIVRSNGHTLVCGNSSRRGFLTSYLKADHKDIIDFLDIGMPNNDIQHITTGVVFPRGYIQEMLNGDKNKREVYAKVLKRRSEIGFPYILFEDNAHENIPNPLRSRTKRIIDTSNICTEVLGDVDPISETFVCVLSSVNLLYYDQWKNTDLIYDLRIILDLFTQEYIDKARGRKGFDRAVKYIEEHRSVGLGVLGWHSYLQSKMIPIGSLQAFSLNNEIFSLLRSECDRANMWMAEKWGEAPYCKGFGLRGDLSIAIAPTKSTSFIMGGVSSGIEPIKSNYHEKVLAKIQSEYKNPELVKLLQSLDKDTEDVWDSISKNNGSVQHLDFLTKHQKDVFKTFSEVSQLDLIKLAAQRQKYIDQSQSLNLMIHPDTPPKDVSKLVLTAWEEGIKTLYYQYSINAAQQFSKELLECSNCEG